MWPATRIHEPPSCRSDSSKPNISTNDKIAEEEPARDEGVLDMARGLVHDVDVRGVEAESRGRETVCDEVDPEELDGNESLGKTKGSRQEDTVRYTIIESKCMRECRYRYLYIAMVAKCRVMQ
jgi:hypothetical protein